MAIEAEDGEMKMFVIIKGDGFTGLGVAANTVLRSIERHQMDVRLGAE